MSDFVDKFEPDNEDLNGGQGGGEAEPKDKSTDDDKERARMQGWVDEDEWRGPKEQWKPADQFLRRNKEHLGLANERIQKLENRIMELTGTIEDFAKYHKTVKKNEYERALKDLKKKQKQAVRDGDEEAFEEVEREMDSLEKPMDERSTGKDGTDGSGDKVRIATPEEFNAWIADGNEWYQNDRELSAFADHISMFVMQQKPNLKGPAFFEEVKARVRKQYPDKFENPRRRERNTVEDGGGPARDRGGFSGDNGRKSYADLPEDAKRACASFIKEGLIKDRQQYVDDYFNQGTFIEMD